MSRIPLVDFSSGASPDACNAIVDALLTVGFFRLRVPDIDSRSVIAAAAEFFDGAEKRDARLALNANFRGYSGVGSEVTSGVRDWHECFDVGPEMPQSPTPMHGPNVWPLSGSLRHECMVYYDRMNALGRSVMQAIALLDESRCTGPNFSLLRLLHYPTRVAPGEGANQHLDIGIGIGAHSDYGFLTFVRSNAAGLQVQFSNDEWVDAPVEPDVFVVNIGDSLSNMTYGVLKATRHRVLIPQEDRVSAAFFFEPKFDQIIRPVDCAFLRDRSHGRAPGAPYVYGEYLYSKYRSSYP